MAPVISVIAVLILHGFAQGESVGSASDWVPDGLKSWLTPALAILCLAIPYIFGRYARRAAVRGELTRGARWQWLTEQSGWIAFGALLFLGGWIDAVRRWTGASLDLNGWPEPALAVSFLPYVVYQLAAIDSSVRAAGGGAHVQRHIRAFQVRMLFACLAPIVVFLGASVLLGKSDWLRIQVEHVGLASVLFTGVMVVVLALLLPFLLRWSWDTVPFPAGPQRERLDEVAEAAEFQPRDIRLWRTGDLMANAAIVGLTPKGRTVLFSDQLLSLLNTRELCAVYAHEIGHARRGHITVFLSWTLGFVFLGDYAARAAMDALGVWAGVGTAILALLLWFFSFGWLSRRFELDADLFSLQTVEDLPALVSALERVGGRDREASGWRHFGVGPRVRFLAKTVSNEPFVTRFRARLRLLTVLGALLALSGTALQLFDLWESLPRDRAVASLAQGEYAKASDLAANLEGEDAEEIRELAAAAIRLGEGPEAASRSAVERALADALTRGDAKAARNLAVVAFLRGNSAAGDLAGDLDDLLMSELPGSDAQKQAASLTNLARQWRAQAPQ